MKVKVPNSIPKIILLLHFINASCYPNVGARRCSSLTKRSGARCDINSKLKIAHRTLTRNTNRVTESDFIQWHDARFRSWKTSLWIVLPTFFLLNFFCEPSSAELLLRNFFCWVLLLRNFSPGTLHPELFSWKSPPGTFLPSFFCGTSSAELLIWNSLAWTSPYYVPRKIAPRFATPAS